MADVLKFILSLALSLAIVIVAVVVGSFALMIAAGVVVLLLIWLRVRVWLTMRAYEKEYGKRPSAQDKTIIEGEFEEMNEKNQAPDGKPPEISSEDK